MYTRIINILKSVKEVFFATLFNVFVIFFQLNLWCQWRYEVRPHDGFAVIAAIHYVIEKIKWYCKGIVIFSTFLKWCDK